jgi:hypothetical protein
MKMLVVARKLVLFIRFPIAAMSAMRLSRSSMARIQRRRCSSIAKMTLELRMRGTRSTAVA